MIKVNVSDFQKAKQALKRALLSIETSKFVTVGIHEDKSDRDEDELSNAAIGAVNEFGSSDGRIPARPWLEPGVSSGSIEYLKIIQKALEDGKSMDEALEVVGTVAVGKVQQYMTDLKTPPNAPSTIAKKGSANPLIADGILRGSVDYKITPKRPQEGL